MILKLLVMSLSVAWWVKSYSFTVLISKQFVRSTPKAKAKRKSKKVLKS